MSNRAKQKIRQIGMVLFVLYVLLLIYFLFFSEGYGRIAEEERILQIQPETLCGGSGDSGCTGNRLGFGSAFL